MDNKKGLAISQLKPKKAPDLGTTGLSLKSAWKEGVTPPTLNVPSFFMSVVLNWLIRSNWYFTEAEKKREN